MMQHRSTVLAAFLSILLMGLMASGCTSGDLFTALPGQYRGSINQDLDEATVTQKSAGLLEVYNQSSKGAAPIRFQVQREKAGELRLLLKDLNHPDLADLVLKKSSPTCLASKEDKAVSAVLCFNGVDLSVALNWGTETLTISVSRVDPNDHPSVDRTSKSYSVSELFQKALDQNFDSAIEFQRVVQAKLTTENDYLNLIPHLSLNSVLNIAALTDLGYLKAVGDIVPFLFPTRWLEAKEAKLKSEAEFDAWILSKANAANVVEGLSYSVAQGEQVLSIIEANEKFIASVRDQVQMRERTGLMQAGASDDIESIVNSIDEGKDALVSNVHSEKISLAQAVGLDYYDSIGNVTAPDMPTLDGVAFYDDAAIAKLSDVAMDRSYELRQISSLIGVSRLNHTASYFQWLDPSGDRNGGLGFDLLTYEKVSASQTQQLIVQREKLEAGIAGKVAATADLANESLKSYQLMSRGVEIQNRRVQRHLNNMSMGIAFSMSDLTNALQEKLKAQIGLLNAQYSYLIVQGNLNRLLLAGNYENIPTDVAQSGWIIGPEKKEE